MIVPVSLFYEYPFIFKVFSLSAVPCEPTSSVGVRACDVALAAARAPATASDKETCVTDVGRTPVTKFAQSGPALGGRALESYSDALLALLCNP